MIAKLYNALAVFAIATMLASGGFLAYLAGSGRLSRECARAIAAVLRGEGAQATQPAQVPESQPARWDRSPDRSNDGSGDPSHRRASVEESRQARRREQLRQFELERAAQDVEARQKLLDQATQTLIEGQEQLAAQKYTWSAERQKVASADQDAGFQRELEYVSGLSAGQAKEHVLRVWKKQPADAVRLFMQLDVGRGKRILAEFKTPEELEIMSQLLEQLRLQDPQGPAGESGKTDGSAP